MSTIVKGYPTVQPSGNPDQVTVQDVGSNRRALDILNNPKDEMLQLDDAGSGVTYVGTAAPGAASSAATWKIKRMTESGADIVIEWANGDAAYDNIWDDRAALSYS